MTTSEESNVKYVCDRKYAVYLIAQTYLKTNYLILTVCKMLTNGSHPHPPVLGDTHPYPPAVEGEYGDGPTHLK